MQRQRQQRDWWSRIWRDRSGRVVIYQHPNAILGGWLVLTLISLFTNSTVANVLWYLSEAFLAVWAAWEILRGVNYFRRALGAVVMIMTIAALFKVGY